MADDLRRLRGRIVELKAENADLNAALTELRAISVDSHSDEIARAVAGMRAEGKGPYNLGYNKALDAVAEYLTKGVC